MEGDCPKDFFYSNFVSFHPQILKMNIFKDFKFSAHEKSQKLTKAKGYHKRKIVDDITDAETELL
jgi:hypothetical protein